MTILHVAGKIRRFLTAFLTVVFATLVVATTVVPHQHASDLSGAMPVAFSSRHLPHTTLSASAAFCPLCDWLASSYVPAVPPVFEYRLPCVQEITTATPILVYLFGLVEPLDSPQRGPPSFSFIVAEA